MIGCVLPCWLVFSCDSECFRSCDEKTMLKYKQGFGSNLQQKKSSDSASVRDTKCVPQLLSQKHLPVCSTRASYFFLQAKQGKIMSTTPTSVDFALCFSLTQTGCLP